MARGSLYQVYIEWVSTQQEFSNILWKHWRRKKERQPRKKISSKHKDLIWPKTFGSSTTDSHKKSRKTSQSHRYSALKFNFLYNESSHFDWELKKTNIGKINSELNYCCSSDNISNGRRPIMLGRWNNHKIQVYLLKILEFIAWFWWDTFKNFVFLKMETYDIYHKQSKKELSCWCQNKWEIILLQNVKLPSASHIQLIQNQTWFMLTS